MMSNGTHCIAQLDEQNVYPTKQVSWCFAPAHPKPLALLYETTYFQTLQKLVAGSEPD